MPSRSIPTGIVNHPFVQHMFYSLVSQLVASQVSDQLSWCHSAYVQVAFMLLNNGPKLRAVVLAIPICQQEAVKSFI